MGHHSNDSIFKDLFLLIAKYHPLKVKEQANIARGVGDKFRFIALETLNIFSDHLQYNISYVVHPLLSIHSTLIGSKYLW